MSWQVRSRRNRRDLIRRLMDSAWGGATVSEQITLETYLAGWTSGSAELSSAAGAVRAIADACADIAHKIACGPLVGDLSATAGATGDKQDLGEWANERLNEALKAASVAAVLSEECVSPQHLNSNGPIAVALDPLDGMSSIDTNIPMGTVFSILPANGKAGSDDIFKQPGSTQLAAGYVIYGPQCALVVTGGQGTQMFTLDPLTRQFWLTVPHMNIKRTSDEYAINASNYRHWSDAVRAYIDDCISGADGPRGSDVNMRWIASLVAECHRILVRGGVFLYPADARKGYERGWLRLVYEANPIAFVAEQAGGQAINGHQRILDVVPDNIHERTPFIFGSVDEMDQIARYKADPNAMYSRSPLFKKRGLLRV